MAAFLPGRNLVVSVGADKKLSVWSSETGEEIAGRDLRARQSGTQLITSLAVSPDGQLIALGESRGFTSETVHTRRYERWTTVTLYAADTLNQRGCIKVQRAESHGPISKLTFSPNSAWLATWSSVGDLHVWDLHRSQPVFKSQCRCFAFSRDGTELLMVRGVTGSNTFEFVSCRLADGKEHRLEALTRESKGIIPSTFSPDLRWYAGFSTLQKAALRPSEIQVADMNAPGTSIRLRASEPFICTEAFSPKGEWIASCHQDGTVVLWEIPTQRALRNFHGYRNAVGVSFAADGRRLLVYGGALMSPPFVDVIDLDATSERRELFDDRYAIDRVATSPRNKWIVAAGERMSLWDGRTARLVHHWPTPGGVHNLSFLSNNLYVATRNITGENLTVWNVESGKEVQLPVKEHDVFGHRASNTWRLPNGAAGVTGEVGVYHRSETVFRSGNRSGNPAAWFPEPLFQLQQRTERDWVGVSADHLYVLKIEGDVIAAD